MKDEQTRLAIEALKAAGCGVLAIHIESRIAELEKDAARLDWLEEGDEGHGFCHTEFGQYRHYAYKGTVRQVIDTAMQKD